jgi:hypothetical protein
MVKCHVFSAHCCFTHTVIIFVHNFVDVAVVKTSDRSDTVSGCLVRLMPELDVMWVCCHFETLKVSKKDNRFYFFLSIDEILSRIVFSLITVVAVEMGMFQ